MNRDPIEEQGGLNLYAFVGNDPVNRWDYFGMHTLPAPVEVESFTVTPDEKITYYGVDVGGGPVYYFFRYNVRFDLLLKPCYHKSQVEITQEVKSSSGGGIIHNQPDYVPDERPVGARWWSGAEPWRGGYGRTIRHSIAEERPNEGPEIGLGPEWFEEELSGGIPSGTRFIGMRQVLSM